MVKYLVFVKCSSDEKHIFFWFGLFFLLVACLQFLECIGMLHCILKQSFSARLVSERKTK